MQEQGDLGAGEDSVVSFQQAVKGHAKKARVCGRPEERRCISRSAVTPRNPSPGGATRIRLVPPKDKGLGKVELKHPTSAMVTSGMPEHSPVPQVRKN